MAKLPKYLGQKGAVFEGLDVIPVSEDVLEGSSMEVTLVCSEFTCRCPITGQPDWAELVIQYTPHRALIESKSCKLYLETYRELGIFHEHLAEQVLKDVVRAVLPLKAKVTVNFNVRGGIAISAATEWVRCLRDIIGG